MTDKEKDILDDINDLLFSGREVSWFMAIIHLIVIVCMVSNIIFSWFVKIPTFSNDPFQVFIILINLVGFVCTFLGHVSYKDEEITEYLLQVKDNEAYAHAYGVARKMESSRDVLMFQEFKDKPGDKVLTFRTCYSIYGYQTQSLIKFPKEIEKGK